MAETAVPSEKDGATIRSSDKERHPMQPLIDGLGKAVARTGVHPDVLTMLSLVVAIIGTYLVTLQEWIVAPFVFLAAGMLDFLDGAVARHTGKVSKAGGYLDSLVDRYVDFLLVFGIMLAVDDRAMWIAGSIALFGVLMTSAARWRVHEDHHPTRAEWGGRDLLGRAGRITLLLSGLLLAGLAVTLLGADGQRILFWIVVAVAVLANLTVVQRIVKARRVLRDIGRD